MRGKRDVIIMSGACKAGGQNPSWSQHPRTDPVGFGGWGRSQFRSHSRVVEGGVSNTSLLHLKN